MIAGRLKTLLPPYILWSVLILIGRGIEGHAASPGEYVEQIAFGQAAPPFYYVPVLVQLYLLSPVLAWTLKRNWKPVLLTAALVQGLVMFARYPVLLGWDVPWATWVSHHAPSWFFPHTVFWFTLGVFAGLHPALFTNWLNRWTRVMPWLTVVLGGFALIEWETLQRLSHREWLNPTATLIDGLYSGAFILTFLTVLHARVPARRQLDAIGERSFGLYLIHAPVLELIARALYHVGPGVLAHQAMFQALLVVGGVGVPILLMALINRSRARPIYNYLFG
jgi:peptidoglycan/LPS O-acetylase OafA/YrhL